MKTTLFLATLAITMSATAAQKSPVQCKSGFTEIARCAAVRISEVPKGLDAISAMMFGQSIMQFQDVVTCQRGRSAYVQMNTSLDSNPEISAEMAARISSTGVTHTVSFQMEKNSSSQIIFGGMAGSRDSNGQMVMQMSNGKKSERVIYAIRCDYKR